LKILRILIFGALALLAACQPRAATPAPADAPTAAPTVTRTLAAATETPAAPAPTPTAAPLAFCSPLQGFVQADLLARISNPFDPPAPGSDMPHQGVDIGDFDPISAARMAVPGRKVQAALPGTVALVQPERFPYGAAVIVETPLEALPTELQAQYRALEDWPPRSPNDALTCPTPPEPFQWDETGRSLYVLYAHLASTADLSVGDSVTCGQALGTVGQSGNALAPHLHFEARIGPAGARLGRLAHYDVSASAQEMAAYCEWRVSGTFKWVDPMGVLSQIQ